MSYQSYQSENALGLTTGWHGGVRELNKLVTVQDELYALSVRQMREASWIASGHFSGRLVVAEARAPALAARAWRAEAKRQARG